MSTANKSAVDRLSDALLVLVHASCLLVFIVPFSWTVVLLALGGYLLRMWAVTAGFHRYFAHRSFKTSRLFQFVLALLGTTAMQNGPLWWASWHRRHHKHSDTTLDPHSPITRGLWHAHMGWVMEGTRETTDLSNVSDLSRYPEIRFLDDHTWMPLVGYALICFAIAGLPGLVWGFSVSTILCSHATMLINSLAHRWGSRRYETHDDSRNNALLAALTLGEGWHNNHHYCMSSARQGFFWWEIDVSYYVITMLSWLGVVWAVRAPPPSALLDHRAGRGRPRARLASPAPPGTAGRGGHCTKMGFIPTSTEPCAMGPVLPARSSHLVKLPLTLSACVPHTPPPQLSLVSQRTSAR
jgi:stearoyl-CoA desaturase (delta-9 desaturase)